MFSCEYCEISKTTYFQEHLHRAAYEVSLGSDCFGLSLRWTVTSNLQNCNITKILSHESDWSLS